MRLIDADALKERAIRVSTVKEHCYMKAVGTREIDKAPTVDTSDIVRGVFEELETILAKNLAMGSSVGPALLKKTTLYYRVNEIDEQIEALKKKYIGEQRVALDDKLADAAVRSAESGCAGVSKDEFIKE